MSHQTSPVLSPLEREVLRTTLRQPVSPAARDIWDRRFREDVASVHRSRRPESASVRVPTPGRPDEVYRWNCSSLCALVSLLSRRSGRRHTMLRCVGVERSLGSIEPGKIADLVLVDGDPAHRIDDAFLVNLVVLRGSPMTRADIDALVPR